MLGRLWRCRLALLSAQRQSLRKCRVEHIWVLRLGKNEKSLILRKVAVNPWLALLWPVSDMQELPERSGKACERGELTSEDRTVRRLVNLHWTPAQIADARKHGG